MNLLAVVDTNVVVSGVLAGGKRSPNAQILDAMLSGKLRFVLSEPLLREYRAALLRPAIVVRHQLGEADVDHVLESLVLNASLVDAAAYLRAPGADGATHGGAPGDEHVLATLEAAPRAVLVSRDRRLREAAAGRREVFTPAEFVVLLASA